MLALPALRNVTTFPLTVHTSGVLLVKVTVSPEVESASSIGLVPKFCAPGLVNVIVCVDFGVTLFDAADEELVSASLFVAVTVNVYAVPLVSPGTVIGLPAPVPVAPPGFAVTVYPVIDAPPLEDGAVKLTEACVSPAVAVPMLGAPGATALTEKICEAVIAAKYSSLPA